MGRILLLALVIFSVQYAGAQSVAQSTSVDAMRSANPSGRTISVSFDNVSLRAAVKTIVDNSGVVLFYSPEMLPTKNVTYSAHDVKAEVALGNVLRNSGVQVEKMSNGSLRLARTQGVKGGAPGIVTGKVMDSKTGRGIAGANVSLDHDARGVTTGDDGTYRISGVSTGNHTITARLVGYAKQSRQVTVGEGATVTVDFKLEPSANVLDQVIVTGTVVQSELRSIPNAITVITAKQIEERGITRIDQLFRGDIPGLVAINQGSSSNSRLGEVMMFSRGATGFDSVTVTTVASNAIKTYVDGVEMADAKYLSQIDPRTIERIEVLTGPQASTIYGSNALNGVMQIFTKRGMTAKPQLLLNFISGIVQNSSRASLAPIHSYDANISGTEGRFSYTAGGSWDRIGRWTPAVQLERFSGFGSGRAQMNLLTVDASIRYGITGNKSRGSASATVSDRSETGDYRPLGSSNVTDAFNSKLHGRTAGITVGYTMTPWWTHEVIIGSDEYFVENMRIIPTRTSIFDSTLFLMQSNSSRATQRYTTTVQPLLANATSLTMTFGADHWRTMGNGISGFPLTLIGSLSSLTVTSNRPQRNTGAFFQGQLGVFDALYVTYGLRAEWNINYGDDAQPNLSPRYGLAYARDLKFVTAKVRASYGRSTKPPVLTQKLAANPETSSTYLALYGPHNQIIANPDLEPESQQGGEGGIELYFGNRGSIVLTRYNQTVNGLIVLYSAADSVRSFAPLDPNEVRFNSKDSLGYGYKRQSQNLNVGSIRNQGWELQSSINLGPFTTRGTYSWTKSRVIGITPRYRALLTNSIYQTGYTFSLLPEHTWSTNISYVNLGTSVALNINGTGFLYRLQDDLFLTSDQFNSRTRLQEVRPRLSLPSNYRARGPGYAMADLSGSHRFTNRIQGVIYVQNLTNFYQADYSALNTVIGRQTKIGLKIRAN